MTAVRPLDPECGDASEHARAKEVLADRMEAVPKFCPWCGGSI